VILQHCVLLKFNCFVVFAKHDESLNQASLWSKIFGEPVEIDVRLNQLKVSQPVVDLLRLDPLLVRERLGDRFLELRRHQVDGQRVEEEGLAVVECRRLAFAALRARTFFFKKSIVNFAAISAQIGDIKNEII
jgi:hypothetical protein